MTRPETAGRVSATLAAGCHSRLRQESASPSDSSSISRRVAVSAAWAQVSRLAEVASSLALSLLLIRVLGPGRYGEYAFLVNAAAVGTVFLSLGFPETLMRYVSLLFAQGEVPQVRFLVRRLALVRVALYVIGTLVLLAFHGVGQALHLPLIDQYWAAIAGLLVSQGLIEFATSYAYARLRSRDVAFARTAGQIVALIFFAIVVVLGRTDVVTAAVTVVISYLLASVMLFARGLGDVLVRGTEQRTPVRPILGFAAGVWAATLFTIGLAGQIDVILLGALRHDAVQIALYSVATLVFVKLGLLLGGWAGTATSSFADIHTRRGAAGSGRLLLVYVRLHILLSLLVYPPIILLSGPITRYVFGPAYAAASGLMAVFGTYWVVSSFLAAGIPLSFLLAIGRQRQAVAIRGVTGVLNVVLDVLLIPSFGALGAILATGTANVLAHISDYVFAARPVAVGYPWPFAIRVAAAGLVGAVPALLMQPHDLIGSMVAAGLYAGLYCGALAVLRPLNAADVELASRLGPRVTSVVMRLASGATPAE